MILAIGLPPALRTAICALRIARVWIFTKSGIISPRRQPRRPSIGFCSCSDLIVASSCLSSSDRPAVLLGPGHLDQLLLEVGQELVERRVDQPDDDGQPVHRLEDALEVALLEDLELGHRGVEGRDRLLLVGGERARRRRAWPWPGWRCWRRGWRRARSPGGRPRGTCARCGTGRCPGRRSCGPGRPPPACRRWSRRPSGGSRRPSRGSAGARAAPRTARTRSGCAPRYRRAGRAVEADPVALLEVGPRDVAVGLLAGVVDDQVGRPGDARLADLAGDDRGVRGRAAAGGDDPLAHGHAVEVVGRGLDPDQDDLLAAVDPLDGGVGVEHGPPDGRARRGVEAVDDLLRALERGRVEGGAQELVDLRGLDPARPPPPC